MKVTDEVILYRYKLCRRDSQFYDRCSQKNYTGQQKNSNKPKPGFHYPSWRV